MGSNSALLLHESYQFPFVLMMLHLLFFFIELSVVTAQNVAMTSTGIAVAAMGPGRGGLIVQQSAFDQPATQPLPTNIASFEDVSIDSENEELVFSLSTVSRRVCSFTISDEGLSLVNCVGEGDNFRVSPFCGISALGGTLIISGGTGGMTVYQYDAVSGMISESPSVLNLDLGVIGHPDVVLVDANLAALSTDFSGSPRFGTQMASIRGDDVTFVRDFRVQDSLGFSSTISPANFPLVNAIYTTENNSYMYTANGSLQIQDPRSNNSVTTLSVSGAPDGFSAVTVAVNSAQKFLLFGGLTGSGGSAILIYDLSVDPSNPSLIETILLGGQRITSLASGDNVAAFTTQGGDATIQYERLPNRNFPSESPTSESSSETIQVPANICFSGDNSVETVDRGVIRMSSLEIGDSVLVEGGKFATVYSFGHYEHESSSQYLQFFTHHEGDINSIQLSADHMIYLREDTGNSKIVPASSIRVGDILIAGDGNPLTVSKIANTTRQGAYAPFTTSGNIVVSGILASNYVSVKLQEETFLSHFFTMQWIAHAFKSHHRLTCSIRFDLCKNETYTDGLSNWILTSFHVVQWLVMQTAFIKNLGCIILLTHLLLIYLVELMMTSYLYLMSGFIFFGIYILGKKIKR